MYYFKKLLNFEELYNLFIDSEASFFLERVKDLHKEGYDEAMYKNSCII